MDKYDDFPITTQTIIAYSNWEFDIKNLFEKLPITATDAKTVKKLTNPKIGAIYQIKSHEATKGIPDKKGYFRNQITVAIFVIDKIIKAKICRNGRFHMTGCKSREHAFQTVSTLINLIKDIQKMEEPFHAIFDIVLTNIKIDIGFKVSRDKVDELIQNKRKDNLYTECETSTSTSLKVIFEKDFPNELEYDKLELSDTGYKISKVNHCPCKPKKFSRHTFLVFNSNKLVQTGRFHQTQMKEINKQFLDFIMNNRNLVEMKIEPKKDFDFSQLKGIF